MAPSSTLHPPTVTISTRAALASSRRITVTRVACTTGLSRLGCVTITPGCASGTEDITAMTIQARVAGVRGGRGLERSAPGRDAAKDRAGGVELGATPALGAGGLYALGGSSPFARTILALLKPAAPERGSWPFLRRAAVLGVPLAWVRATWWISVTQRLGVVSAMSSSRTSRASNSAWLMSLRTWGVASR